jgi:hypothetical protein
MHTDIRSESLKDRDNLGNRVIVGRIIFKRILKKQNVRMWNGFIWLRAGMSCVLL